MQTSMTEFAKYPFVKEASEFVRQRDVDVTDLVDPEYSAVLERAIGRVEEALRDGVVSWKEDPEPEIEILSYPVSVLIVSSVGDLFLRRRYALAEARRMGRLLSQEDEEKIISIVRDSFGWRARQAERLEMAGLRLTLSVADYLKYAPRFQADEWKLINRLLSEGEVSLSREELVRLAEEEIKDHIERRIASSPRTQLPEDLTSKLGGIRQLLTRFKERFEIEEAPEGAIPEAFPPCVKRLYSNLLAKQHLSHMGRLTLTSFLLNGGMSPDQLINLYTSVSDFDEDMTRYQVMHIAGHRGSRTKYVPPKCSTLKTHGLCNSPDVVCSRVKHPLAYYRRKIRLLRRETGGGESG